VLSLQNTIQRIYENLDRGLPGEAAQLKMSPITRKLKRDEGISYESFGKKSRKSAVLIHLYPENEDVYVTFIKRAPDKTVHSRQISFPGGKTEELDASFIDTALREAEEEVNIKRNKVSVLGELTPIYIPPSNFDVYPYIGYTTSKPKYVLNHEVDRLILAPLTSLLSPENRAYKTIKHRTGNNYVVPCYKVGEDIIWGATAMILSEFLELVR
jgi:8-oxo-dGTP pyrophosphatase MutT (NUDIX family)